MTKLIAIVKLMRLHQWVKNLFLFIPLFFAGELFNQEKLVMVALAFVAFSISASAIYIINDARDIKEDRNHPEKKHRPLASGAISLQFGYGLFFILLLIGVSFAYWLDTMFFGVLLAYLLLNLAYSFGLKKVPILDLLIVSIGFVLRVISGGFIADVLISQWLIVMVFLLSLFIVLAKRRDDLVQAKSSGYALRDSSKNYNMEFINSVLTMLSGIIVVAYIMYCLSEDTIARFTTDKLYLTTIFVVTGILRYLQIALVENNSGYPTRIIFTDRFIQITLAAWALSFFFIIYYA